MSAELDKIDAAYQEADGENIESCIAEIEALHKKVYEDAKANAAFSKEAVAVCGGAYIPHLMWIALGKYWEDEQARTEVHDLVAAFVQSNFEEHTQRMLRQLLVPYFMKETDFEISRLRTRVLRDVHPSISEWFEGMLSYQEHNAKVAKTFLTKFAMLHSTFPNFSLLNLPLSQLEETLAEA